MTSINQEFFFVKKSPFYSVYYFQIHSVKGEPSLIRPKIQLIASSDVAALYTPFQTMLT